MAFSKKTYRSAALLLITVLVLSGCRSSGEESSAGGNYRDHFTEEEKKTGTAAFELMKDVKVDAQVTTPEKYEDGLKKYYMQTYCEKKGKRKNAEFMKDPYLYGKKASEVQEMVAAEMEAAYTGKAEVDKKSLMLTRTMKKKNGSVYEIVSYWDRGGKWPDDGGSISVPNMHVDSPDVSMDETVDLANSVILYNQEYDKAEVPFIEDPDAAAEHLKAFLEKLLGRKLYDGWNYIPVTKETVDRVNQVLELDPESEYYRQPPKKDRCLFQFYVDVDGLPFLGTSLSYHLREGETASPMTRMGAASANSSTLAGLGEVEQRVIVTEDGVAGLGTSYVRGPGKVYKERAEVLGPDQILGKVREYYDRQLITAPVTVTELLLEYMGYFTDGSEGEIQATVAPFWVVSAQDGTAYGKYFIYDAFTGELIE